MKPEIRLGDFMIGIEGLAILRTWPDDPEAVSARVDEIQRLLDDATLKEAIRVTEVDSNVGYEAISATYDESPLARNPVIIAEQPALFELLAELTPGRALDAACGTGRCSSFLASRGHELVGLDQSRAMLEIARAKVPEVRFHEGRLEELPFEDASFNLVVCTLALTHAADLIPPMKEFARVLVKGGRLITSDVHPYFTRLGLHAFYRIAEGESSFVRNHHHSVSKYVDAFQSFGLTPVKCLEPAWTEESVLTIGNTAERLPEAALQALVGLPLILIWETVKSW